MPIILQSKTQIMSSSEDGYFDRIFISLKREYEKDEFVADLVNRLKKKDIEIGMLKSEVDHLEDDKEARQIAKSEALKDNMYVSQKAENKKMKKEIKNLRETISSLIAKSLQLKDNQ